MKTIYYKKQHDFLITCLLSMVLAALRSQMLLCFALCLGIAVYLAAVKRKTCDFQRVLIGCMAAVLLAGGLYCGVKVLYKNRITDNKEDAMTLELALLANLLYVSGEEDIDCYEEPELQNIYRNLYTLVDERQLNNRYADGMMASGDHMCDSHDEIKYGVINEVYYSYVYRTGIYENRESNMNLEEFIGGIEGPLLRKNWYKLILNSLCEWPKGYMRSIFTSTDRLFPFNLLFCVLMYASSLYLCVRDIVKNGIWSRAVLMLVILAFIAMSVAGTAITIYVVMRYLIYNQGLFYISYIILFMQYKKAANL